MSCGSSGDVLTERIENDGGEYCLDRPDQRLKGSVELKVPVNLKLEYYDEGSNHGDFDRAKIHISSNLVSISGLRISGSVEIGDGVRDITLDGCLVRGHIRVGRGCRNISISCCEIEGSGSFALLISSDSGVSLSDTIFRANLVAISVSQEVPMSFSHAASDKSGPNCRIERCTFDSNSTDLVVQIRIVSSVEGAHTAFLDPESILSLPSELSGGNLKSDISISGRLELPLSFKIWPIPVDKLRGLCVGRRGARSNKRMCRFRVDGNLVVMTEDAPTENISEGRRKRSKETTAESKYSKAELDHYSVLGIFPGSDKAAITAAYKKQALMHHPDKVKGQEDHQTFIRIKKARDELIKVIDSRS